MTVMKVLKEQSLGEGARCQKSEVLPSKWVTVRGAERTQGMTIMEVQGQRGHQEPSLDHLQYTSSKPKDMDVLRTMRQPKTVCSETASALYATTHPMLVACKGYF